MDENGSRNNNYLIPANSKKSQLILSIFTLPDLIICITGIIVTIVLFLAVKTQSLLGSFGLALPALIAIFLVLPIPNYHNVMTFIGNVWKFFSNRRKYYWKGWCACYDNRKSKDDNSVYFK